MYNSIKCVQIYLCRYIVSLFIWKSYFFSIGSSNLCAHKWLIRFHLCCSNILAIAIIIVVDVVILVISTERQSACSLSHSFDAFMVDFAKRFFFSFYAFVVLALAWNMLNMCVFTILVVCQFHARELKSVVMDNALEQTTKHFWSTKKSYIL